MDHETTHNGTAGSELTLDQLWREFPGWEFWEGTGGRVYCRKLNTSPPVVFGGDSPAQLRDQIIEWRGE